MKFRLSVFLVTLPLLMSQATTSVAASDSQFLAARDATRAGDRNKLERLAPELQGYELAVYVDYWRLLLDLSTTDPSTIRSFLERNDKSYIAEKLRGDWLKQLGKKQQWSDFDREFPALAQPDQEISCYAMQSRRARGDASANDEAIKLWLTLIEPPTRSLCPPTYLVRDSRVRSAPCFSGF